MRIQFLGAAHEVTGSCTLLEVGETKYLVDCGMEQGIDVFENKPIPVEASKIDAVFLTHAHIDHSGMLPKLYKDGFRGKIYATRETCNLCNIMLRDSAHIQELEAGWQKRKSDRAGKTMKEPVYTLKDALGAISLFRPVEYGEIIQIGWGTELRFTDVGHLLGSACIEIWLTEGEEKRKIVFSGDVGNTNQPIINDPKIVEETDYLVIESTYGNRNHKESNSGDVIVEFAKCIQRTFNRGGNVIIPSFAVGRTQELLYAIRKIKDSGMIKGHKNFAVYVDSPLAVEATSIFLQCDTSCLDEETFELVKQGINPIWFDGLSLSVSTQESIAITTDKMPKIVIASSGMCEAGRIRHHLKHNLWKKENTILFVGYQAENSLGRLLQQGVKEIKLFGDSVMVRAEIATLHGTSGHADQNGLLRWLEGFKNKPKKVFVNHGDDLSCSAFCDLLISKGYDAEAPYSGTEYDLIQNKMTVYADSKRIDRAKSLKGSAKARAVHNDLISAVNDLMKLADSKKDYSNSDNAKLTAQIRALIDKWK